jgi:predicted methyltransferase
MIRLAVYVLAAAALAACSHRQTVPTPASEAADYRMLVDASDRAEADRKLDTGRKPAEFLAFLGAQPGMVVAELGAGGGYTAELLARAVGPTGTVYAQNSKFILERFAEKPLEERLAKPVNSHIVRVDREFDDPFPPDVKPLDLVVMNAFYHDTVWLKVDRAQMNRKIFEALKPGGHYVVIDSSAKPGTGMNDVQTLHRIDENVVRQEIEAAGFKLESSSDFLRNPEDTRDWSASPGAAGEKRGTSDRFAFRFVKP